MNVHEKEAKRSAKVAYNDILGGIENSVSDGHLDEMPSREYLLNAVYDSIDWSNKHIKFAGSDFIKGCIKKWLDEDGL